MNSSHKTIRATNLNEISRARAKGGIAVKTELAEEFLKRDLYRNAAGKAFQAWKAYLSYLALGSRDLLINVFKGRKRLRNGKVVDYVDLVIAVMPTTLMKAVAQTLATRHGGEDIAYYTELAIDLHEYQYNGPDPLGVLSRYVNDEMARVDIEKLIKYLRERVKA
ncbi:PaREP1 family protein [Vulcanisaeta distributa]|uniref:PaREP1 family protein n=1 Tax=Vulcanisaeta distributa TaxID=164451 RepID=UPI000A5C5C70|nr:PaREP1 family protein [Vulcanisaeta distributa]